MLGRLSTDAVLSTAGCALSLSSEKILQRGNLRSWLSARGLEGQESMALGLVLVAGGEWLGPRPTGSLVAGGKLAERLGSAGRLVGNGERLAAVAWRPDGLAAEGWWREGW